MKEGIDMPAVEINTVNHNNFYSDWYYPNTEFKLPKENFVKLPDYYSFDLERVREQIRQIESNYGYKPFPVKKDGSKVRRTYQGIGLTARPDAADPLYDALHLYGNDGELDITNVFLNQGNKKDSKQYATLSEKDFSEPTEVCSGYLAEVLSKFKSPLTKTRILNLKPKGIIAPHVDFPYYQQIRVHACIFSNDDTWWEVEGEKFQIPTDGNFYWFDTGKYHAVWNDGDTDRIDLSVNLSVYQDRQGNFIIDKDTSIVDLIVQGKI